MRWSLTLVLVLCLAGSAFAADIVVDTPQTGTVSTTDAGDTVTVTSTGSITTTHGSAPGIYAPQGGHTITIDNGGSVSTAGKNSHGVRATTGNNTVDNAGALSTYDIFSYGIFASGDVTNTGSISTALEGSRGICLTGPGGTAVNWGTIETSTGGAYYNTHGMYSDGGGTLINEAGGTITLNGLNSGGLHGYGDDTLINRGAILTNNDGGCGIRTIGDNSTITNPGSISTQGINSTGFYVEGDNNTATNSGSITVPSGCAIYVSGINNTATNSGSIAVSDNSLGIAILGNNNTITHSGSITAPGSGVGVQIEGNNNTLNISGSITVPSTAINATGVSTVNILAGSSIVGDIKSKIGDQMVNFNLGSSGAFTYNHNIFRGAGSWTGNVQSGRVYLNGGNELDTLAVSPGAFLGGTGTIYGALTNNGTVGTGMSIGTLIIGGNYTQSASGTLEVEVAPGGLSDLLAVKAAAQIAGQLKVVPSGVLQDGDQWTILTAGKGVTGTFSSVISSPLSAVLSFSALYQHYYVQLLLTRNSYSSVAGTFNQKAVASVLDSALSTASGDFADLLQGFDYMSREQLQNALEQMHHGLMDAYSDLAFLGSKRFYASLAQLLSYLRLGLEMPRSYSSDYNLRPMLAAATSDPSLLAQVLSGATGRAGPKVREDQRWAIFGQGFGAYSEEETTTERTGYDALTRGVLSGLHYKVGEHWLAGLAGEYAWTDVDWDASRGDGTIETYRVSPFVSYFRNPWRFDLAAAFARHSYETRRRIPFASRTAKSDHHGNEYSFYAGGGYRFEHSGLVMEPLASLQYTYLEEQDYTESGAGALNLRVAERETESLVSKLGPRLSHTFGKSWFKVTPEVRA